MIRTIIAALSIGLLASCASEKSDSCPTCPITGKPLGTPAKKDATSPVKQ